MSSISSMPSPTGSDSEGLYVLRGRRDATHADDAVEETTSLAPDDSKNQVS